MSTFILVLTVALAGYVASIFTWPQLRQALVGAETELSNLRAKARELEAMLRG